MRRLKNIFLSVVSILALSVLSLAPSLADAQTIGGVIGTITGTLSLVIPLLFLIATIIFLWGIIMYLTAGGDEEKIKEGRNYIIWGLIALAVMVALWGFVRIVVTFFFGSQALPGAPSLPSIPGAPSGSGSGGNPNNVVGYWCTNQGVTAGCFSTLSQCQQTCGQAGGTCSAGQACVRIQP